MLPCKGHGGRDKDLYAYIGSTFYVKQDSVNCMQTGNG